MSNQASFVLMPFSESLSEVYDFLIKSGLEEAGYEVKRADDIKSQSNILEDIVIGISTSDLIIADLTDSNPNVYYELGIAHALGKKVILITQDINELPFDLRSYRVISYGTHFSKMQKAKEELIAIAKEAIMNKLPFGNPVKDFAPNFLSLTPNNSQHKKHEETEELGILDFQQQIEDSFSELTKILENVGEKLTNELTPEITTTTSKITSNNQTTGDKRALVQNLANHMENYGKFLIPNNERYKELLTNIETSLEYLFSSDMEYGEEVEEGILSFLNSLQTMEEGAFAGRQGFQGMLDVQKKIPKIEKSFNRSNKFMQVQIEQFIENIDLTISVSSRARMLGNSLLKKKKH